MTSPWHMAAFRHRQPVREHKMHGPVGEKRYSWGERLEDSWMPHPGKPERYSIPDAAVEAVNALGVPQHEVSACMRCGYHVCSCPSEEERLERLRLIFPGADIIAHDYLPRGQGYKALNGRIFVSSGDFPALRNAQRSTP